MTGWQIALLVVLIVMVAAIVVLSILGRRAQKKKEEQDAQLAAAAQTVSMLIIDKKRLRITDSGLSQQVIDQIPKLMRRSKLPIVKAKVGPKVMSLIADESIFDEIPVKKEVKATVSGLYITAVRGLRGPLEKPEKKKGFRAKMRDKYNSLNAELKKEKEQPDTASGKKSKKK
jgi:type II secretory pathway pseudopilin PulG